MIEFWKQPRTFYPPIFRVLIGLVLLLDMMFTFPSGTIQFNPEFVSYPVLSDLISFLRDNHIPFHISYGLVLILFILGIGKNITVFVVYIFHFIIFFVSPHIMNWGDVILRFTLLYFVFVDSFQSYSFTTHKSNGKNLRAYVSQLAVWSIILHLFLIYLSNGFYKSLDNDWQQGFAPFYSFSQFSGFESSLFYPVLSNEVSGKIISYLVITQQLTFIPLVLWKRTRFFAIIIGVIVHLIMFFQFGLWKFETIIILHYGFLLSDNEWKGIISRFKYRKSFP